MILDIIKHAKQLVFDNSKSALKSNNVQGAIDELNDSLIAKPNKDNLIEQFAIPKDSEVSYTATQDCFVEWTIYSAGTPAKKVYLNGLMIGMAYCNGITTGYIAHSSSCKLRSGDIITFQTAAASTYNVYGIE